MIIEICAYSVQSAIYAQSGGADRVELCSGPVYGGTTPSAADILLTRDKIDINLHVLIRPRGGDFFYSSLEYETMVKDVEFAKKAGVEGVVIGLLNPDGTVDIKRTQQLVNLAHPLSVTFHRAFDMTRDPVKSLEDIIKTGTGRLLTSGQKPTADEGKELISELISKAKKDLIVMPGSGINSSNILEIINKTNAREVHLSAKSVVSSKMTFRKGNNSDGIINNNSEYDHLESDIEKIKNIINLVKEI